MKKTMDIRHGRHCVFNLHVHLVFVTKYRRAVFTQAVLNELENIFSSICKDFEVSSRLIRKMQFPEIEKILWGNHLWSPSYFAGSCGGAPIEIIRQYIEQQQTPKD